MLKYIFIRLGLLLWLLLCSVHLLTGQVSGAFGKKVILKTNVIPYILNNGISIEGELAIFRRSTLQFELETSSTMKRDYSINYNEPVWDSAFADINMLGVFYKIYKNRSLGAPFGSYHKLGIRFGNVDFRTTVEKEVEVNQFLMRTIREEYIVENVPAIQFAAGVGSQFFLNSRVVVDVSGTFDLTFHNMKEFNWDYSVPFDKFSSNLATIPLGSTQYDSSIINWYSLSVGFTMNVSLGILLI